MLNKFFYPPTPISTFHNIDALGSISESLPRAPLDSNIHP